MRKRLFNRTTLAGIGSWLLAVLPFWESDGMSPTVIALMIIGSALVIVGFLEKSQKRLKRSELDSLIRQRELHLIPMKNIIRKRLKIADRLTNEAGQYPLEEYKKRYLPFHKSEKLLSIQNALVKRKFMWNNHYYQLIKDQDKEMQPIISDYGIFYAQIKDGKLRKYLKQLWRVEHWTNSFKAYCILAKGEKEIPHTATGLNIARIGENINEDNIDNALRRVFRRIDELLDGDEDE